MDELGNLREEIFAKIKEYYLRAHTPKPFVPGETRLHYGGRVFDEREMLAMVDAVLEFWLTAGRYTREFEERLSKFLGVREVIPVNSGSSANLVAVTTLCSPQLQDRLQPGDEVITPATTFPTTLAPIVQNRLVPVLMDCELGTYNLQVNDLERALSQKTRAIFLPHTLGNPAPMDRVVEFAREHRLYLIEDTCDALGSTYSEQMVGTFGQLATVSFYPAHHITTGEGGAVYTNNLLLARIARTLRDWGRGDGCNSDGGGPRGRGPRRSLLLHRNWLQPETHGNSGRPGGCSAWKTPIVCGSAQAQFQASVRRDGPARRPSYSAALASAIRSLLVCLPAHRARPGPLQPC